MSATKTESKLYSDLGASSSKEGVHKALAGAETPGSDRSGFFAEVCDDVAGDPSYYSLLHADGAGTKSIIAYLAYRESGDASYFSSLAEDSLVMNLDDVACVGAFEGLTLSNTIGRNRRVVPDEAVEALVKGYRSLAKKLGTLGIPIKLAGGETADMGDSIRTLVVDSTLFARVQRKSAVSTDNIEAGDVIVGLSGTGKATYEEKPNSGIGSNGFTLARHAMIAKDYAKKYPEIVDPNLNSDITYQGKLTLFDKVEGTADTVADLLLSPTRTYAPIIKALISELGSNIHGLIHCSGGGQTKIIRFGKNKRYIKDNLFPCPPIFKAIQSSVSAPWREMYSVFNMGHRLEVLLPAEHLKKVVEISNRFGIAAQQIGHVTDGDGNNSVQIVSEHGEFSY